MIVDGRLAGIGERESVADVARVLGRQCAAIVWRTFAQDRIEEMAAYAGVPVINALTDRYHPCQVLADLQTVREHRGRLAGLTLAYVGDGANNMAHSYLLAGALAGLHVRIGAPAGVPARPGRSSARAETLAAGVRRQRAGHRVGRRGGRRRRRAWPPTPGSRWAPRTTAGTGPPPSPRTR